METAGSNSKRILLCPFSKWERLLKGRNLLQEGVNSFLYEQFFIEWKILFITLSDLPRMLLFVITYVRIMRNGCYANDSYTICIVPIAYVMTKYCKFRNFLENLIFANCIKRHICVAENKRLEHELRISVNDIVISPYRENFIFTKLCICEVSQKLTLGEISEFPMT